MSSPGYAAPLRLDLRPSPVLAAALISSHGGALALLATVPLPGWAAAALAVLVAASLLRALARHALLWGREAVTGLVWEGDGAWTLVTRAGSQSPCHLSADSYVGPRLTVLNFTGPRRRSVLVLPDRVAQEGFRRLRVRLMLEGGKGR